MRKLLEEKPSLFVEYASTYSVITLLYSSALYGYNNTPPVTITSASAKVIKDSIMRYLGVNTPSEFDHVYRGLKRVSHGLIKRDDCPGFIEASSFEPINDKSCIIQHYASHAYRGGYNSCSEVGYFPFETYDYDLQNAYPTAMCLVPDINWDNPIKLEIVERNLTLNDFKDIDGKLNPLKPFVGYIRFEFPKCVKYPCISVNTNGVPVYPLTSQGLDGVYAAGANIYLALKLGANIYCERGYFLNTLINGDTGKDSRSLAFAVKQLVIDRNKAKIKCGKKSLEELTLKVMVNSGYGKVAQGVIEKRTWNAYKDMMESLGASSITNPVSSMMITSIVQCELIAAQNQIELLNYTTCSVTTDGFITDCPEDLLKSLNLYGFRSYMESARLFLTDGTEPELWEIKHIQNDLINFTTRGNVSLHDKIINPYMYSGKIYEGVCAHNGLKSKYESDSYKDRLWLMKGILSRNDKVKRIISTCTSLKEMLQKNKAFAVIEEVSYLSMDFDMKRKPDRTSLKTDYPVIDGTIYEIAHFKTLPFVSIEEFLLYREKAHLVKCLRTNDDWDIFFTKIDFNGVNMRITDSDWSILKSCIMRYRAGLCDIPAFHGKSPSEICKIINEHNTSEKIFKKSDWKNAGNPNRQANMLPLEYIEDKLKELQSIGVNETIIDDDLLCR